MQQRPKILMDYGRINEPVRIPTYDLIVNPVNTITTVDTAASSGTLTVKNITGFAVNQILLIGEPGNKGSEIIKTHAATAPTGSTITLASNTVFPHSSSTSVKVLNFDQVEISTASTLTGSKSVLATVSIVADDTETKYNDITVTTGYYFARFKNSITSAFSPYSDGVPVGGYTPFTARSIIDNALGQINKKTSDILTDEYGFQQINNCQMECLREFKRWSFMQVFNSAIGTVTTGNWKVALPIDCDDQNTTKSVYNFRIGKEDGMQWVDKEDWNFLTQNFAYTTLKNAIIVGSTSIVLTSSADFTDSGSLTIGANTYSYTANDRSTGTLTIPSSTTTNNVNEDAFQNASVGFPQYFTTYGGYLYHYPIADSTYNNRNYYLDYYKSLTMITSDADLIVLPDPTVVQYYLSWKYMLRQQNGEENDASRSMYNNYLLRRDVMKKKESLNREFILMPDIS